MPNKRLVIATILAGGAFAIAAYAMIGENFITGMQTMPGHAGMASSHLGGLSVSHIPGLVALGLSMAAFVVSWKQRSYPIAGLLVAAGILYALHLGTFLGDHSNLAIFGPLTGLIFGHVILALVVAKGIGSVRTPIPKTVG
jgi:hypothetical protein